MKFKFATGPDTIIFLINLLTEMIIYFKLNISLYFFTNDFLTLELGFNAISHVIFRTIGGVLATLLIQRQKPRLLNWANHSFGDRPWLTIILIAMPTITG